MRYRGKGGEEEEGDLIRLDIYIPQEALRAGRGRERGAPVVEASLAGRSLSVALKKKGDSFVVKFLSMYNHERTKFVQFQCERKGWNMA